jgi:5-methylcytosine-specific restriction endonuclease McrA
VNLTTYHSEAILHIANSKGNRKWKQFICEEIGHDCHWCKQEMRLDQGFMNSATFEHMIPQSQGGSNERWNLVIACYRCNSMRADKDADVFEIEAKRFRPDTRTVAEAAIINKRERKRRYKQRKRECAGAVQTYNIFNMIFDKIRSFA